MCSVTKFLFNWIISSIYIFYAGVLITCDNTLESTVEPKKDTENILYYEAKEDYIEFYVINSELYELLDVDCRGKPRTINPKRCYGLEHCMNYNAVANIKNLTTGIPFEHMMPVSSSYAKPSIEFKEPKVKAHTIHLAWTTKNLNCVDKFRIILTSQSNGNNYDVMKEKDDIDVSFDKLNPCGSHNIEFIITDINQTVIEPNKTLCLNTTYEDPGNVASLKFENKKNSVVVSWKNPTYITCIENYRVIWIETDCIKYNSPDKKTKCEWGSSEILNHRTTEYTISGLEGCENYTVEIITNDTYGKPNEIRSNFLSDEQVPSEIDILNITTVTATNIYFEWPFPKQNPKCVESYHILIIGPIQQEKPTTNWDFNIEAQWLILDKLKPCGIYNFTISTKSKSGNDGKSTLHQFAMNRDKPSSITNFSIKKIYPVEFIVGWNLPTYAELCISSYIIEGHSERDPFNEQYKFSKTSGLENKVQVTNLVSCMEYVIKIIPKVKVSESEEILGDLYEDLIIMQEKEALSPIYEETYMKTRSSLKVRVNIDPNDQNNVCPILFIRFQCRAKEEAIEYVKLVKSFDDFEAVIEPLSPYTTYVCETDFFNSRGWSLKKSQKEFTTDIYYPQEPILENFESSKNTITIQWREPEYINGEMLLYKLYLKEVEPIYTVYPHCSKNKQSKSVDQKKNTDKYTYSNLLPYYKYSLQMAAENTYGTGSYWKPVFISTEADVSKPTEHLNVTIDMGESDSSYVANVTLKWRIPCQTNGDISHYIVKFKGVREDYDEHNVEKKIPSHTIPTNGYVYYSVDFLKPEFSYTARIAIAVNQVDGISKESEIHFISPAGIPKKYNDTEMSNIGEVNAFKASNPTTSAMVKISGDAMRSEMGKIMYAAILISELGCQNPPTLNYGKINVETEWPEILTWFKTQNEPCISQYQTTPERWQPLETNANLGYKSNDDLEFKPKENIEFIIGSDQNCKEEAAYCNGPLKPNTRYNMVLRLFTRNGYSDVMGIKFETDSVVELYLILTIITSILLFSFILGFLYSFISKKRLWYRQSQSGSIEDQSGDISLKNFIHHYNEIAKKDKLQREFKELGVVENDANICSSITRYNEIKNRYSNIFPYDKNRVILDTDSDGMDYINASFINGYKHKKSYIATQGPKPETFVDFWKMVLQYNVKIIVMLTKLREENVVKCSQYFPTTREMKFGNNIIVTCKKETITDLYERRELILKHIGDHQSRNVLHYFFRKWPDHVTPENPIDLITFIKKVKSEKNSKRSPVIVHCSAGVGRTGTYIALDIIMQRMKSEAKINIYDIVKELRFQRMKMVQNSHQYHFLYTSAKQLVNQKFANDFSNKNSKTLSNNGNGDCTRNNSTHSFIPNNIVEPAT